MAQRACVLLSHEEVEQALVLFAELFGLLGEGCSGGVHYAQVRPHEVNKPDVSFIEHSDRCADHGAGQLLGPPRIGFDLFEKGSTLRFLSRFALASVFVGNGRCLILWVTLTNELADVLADGFLARSPLQGHMDHLQSTQFVPVLPKPPSPRSVWSSSSTTSTCTGR